MLQQDCLKGQNNRILSLLETRWYNLAQYMYTDPKNSSAQRYRQTDAQTDDMIMPIADHTVIVHLCSRTIG